MDQDGGRPVDREVSNVSWFQMGGVPQNAVLASECRRNAYQRVRTVVPTLVGSVLGGVLWVSWLGPLLLS